ncbi:hypothetical protein Zmor_024812 [Zophobas morio]|uniref:Transmembrane protein n=1 Tax=Zophobas morio TaxID=2755281 RepID=A0AA38HL43_9CUCU|nr:hypothetical protein Zmor_024812 [Zophobas morio]
MRSSWRTRKLQCHRPRAPRGADKEFAGSGISRMYSAKSRDNSRENLTDTSCQSTVWRQRSFQLSLERCVFFFHRDDASMLLRGITQVVFAFFMVWVALSCCGLYAKLFVLVGLF